MAYNDDWEPKTWKGKLALVLLAPFGFLIATIGFIILVGVPVFLIWLFFFS